MSERTAAARVGAAGRVTLPAELRRELDIERGDYVVVNIEPVGGDEP